MVRHQVKQFHVLGLADTVNTAVALRVDHGRHGCVELRQPFPLLQVRADPARIRADHDPAIGLELAPARILDLRRVAAGQGDDLVPLAFQAIVNTYLPQRTATALVAIELWEKATPKDSNVVNLGLERRK